MVLIGELVKTLNLYSNPRVGNYSHVNNNSNARGASKKIWMQKAQSNWVFLPQSLCFIALLFMTIILWFLFSLFLGFALHYIHAFHSRIFFNSFKINNKKRKRERKRKQIVFCIYFLGYWKQGWSIYLHITCFCILFSLDELIYYTLLVETL